MAEKMDLSNNHWTIGCFKETLTKRQLQAVFDKHGSWVLRRGRRANIRSRHLGVGRYEVWLEDEK